MFVLKGLMSKSVELNENHAVGRRTAEGLNFKDWMGRSNTVRQVYTLRHGDVVGILTTGTKSFGCAEHQWFHVLSGSYSA